MMKCTANEIGSEGAIRICESLMKNTTLTTLNLDGAIEEEKECNRMNELNDKELWNNDKMNR